MAFAVALTILLFKTLGPRRTRLAAQIVAAVIGAAFVIGLQLAAIQSIGSLSRTDMLMSAEFVALAPDADSLLYWPARAAFGDIGALAAVLGAESPAAYRLDLSVRAAAGRMRACRQRRLRAGDDAPAGHVHRASIARAPPVRCG